MAEYLANAVQTVELNQPIVFTASIPCTRGNVIHEDETGIFILRGNSTNCFARYQVTFNGNIALPTGGTVGPISVAFSVGGSTVPASAMEVTPAAVEQYFNISREMPVAIFCGCCQTVTVTNTSDQAILMKNATIEI